MSDPTVPVVAWHERQARRMSDGVVTKWGPWYPCEGSLEEAKEDAPDHIPYEWRPLVLQSDHLAALAALQARLDESHALLRAALPIVQEAAHLSYRGTPHSGEVAARVLHDAIDAHLPLGDSNG